MAIFLPSVLQNILLDYEMDSWFGFPFFLLLVIS